MLIRVSGTVPGPQGSKSFRGMSKKGHAILTESSKKVAPWRESVSLAAQQAQEPMLIGPVRLDVAFYLLRPQSAKNRQYPDRTPDLDKLVRSTCDGLTAGGAWEDDARVVSLKASKVYVDDPRLVGASIEIRRAR